MSRPLPWPPILQRVADELGDAVAVSLVREFGGTRIKLPRNPGPGTRLAKVLGTETARRVVDLLGHGELPVPICAAVTRALWREEVRAARRAGATISALARRYRCSERTISRAVRCEESGREVMSPASAVGDALSGTIGCAFPRSSPPNPSRGERNERRFARSA